jgi:DNA-binding NarL/FixJ family response regulator
MLAIIVSPKVLLREGIASFLQSSRYKVVGVAARPAELPPTCCPKGQRALAIVGVNQQNGDPDDAPESIRLLRIGTNTMLHTTASAMVILYVVVTTTSTGAAYALDRIAIDSFAVRGPQR